MRTDAIIIGGGQAGLAISRCLAARGIDHMVLERGRVAERWRSAHWDSLRLLTPNWQSRLPGYRYAGPDPDGFMRAADVVGYLECYARSFAPPLQEHTTVLAVDPSAGGYRVTTDRGTWQAPAVVIATGHCDTPLVPALAAELPAEVTQLTPASYRNPADLPPGGVLVVGASATGVQLADEIQRSGRPVTLSVGRHTRLPRHYRGRDIMWWLDRMGVLARSTDEVADRDAAQREPSLQLVGRADLRSLDLGVLQAAGVRLVGRTLGASGARISFADDLGVTVGAADAKVARLLDRIDAFAAVSGLGDTGGGEPIRPLRLRLTAARPPGALQLRRSGIRSVIWATGYVRGYAWLKLPLLDARGELRQHAGITPAPGVYTLGLRFQRRRNSSFLDGVGADARELADRIAMQLGARDSAAA